MALLVGPTLAHAVQRDGSARIDLGAGYDSNAGRDLDGQDRASGVLLGVLTAEGVLSSDGGGLAASGRYDLGAKRFFEAHADDLVAQAAALGLDGRAGPLALGLSARAKDRRSRDGDRDYSDLAAAASVGFRAWNAPVRLEAGAERFLYRPAAAYRFGGPTADGSVTFPLAKRHRLVLQLDGALRSYGPASADAAGQERSDTVAGGGLTWRYRGPLLLSLGYGFLSNGSNQFGFTYQRHRVDGSAALFLPWRIALAATGALQLTRFPDGVALAPELLLAVDDESTNSATLSLSRRFGAGLVVELKAAGYQASYASNGLAYHRATAQLTVGWED